jgi:hypothetical protein
MLARAARIQNRELLSKLEVQEILRAQRIAGEAQVTT